MPQMEMLQDGRIGQHPIGPCLNGTGLTGTGLTGTGLTGEVTR